MDSPAIQLYLGDWRSNANLRRCSWAAKGVLLEVMALMHDSAEYGLLRWPLREIARAVGCPASLVRELADKAVLRGADAGACAAYVYTPRSGGVDGEPVILVPEQPGPLWYSKRMVRDEYVRHRRGKTTRYRKVEPGPAKAEPKAAPKSPPMPTLGGTLEDGASASSFKLQASEKLPFPNGNGTDGPPDDPVKRLFDEGLRLLTAAGQPEKAARSLLGKLRQMHGDLAVMEALEAASTEHPSDVVPWLMKACGKRSKSNRPGVHVGEQDYGSGWGST